MSDAGDPALVRVLTRITVLSCGCVWEDRFRERDGRLVARSVPTCPDCNSLRHRRILDAIARGVSLQERKQAQAELSLNEEVYPNAKVLPQE